MSASVANDNACFNKLSGDNEMIDTTYRLLIGEH